MQDIPTLGGVSGGGGGRIFTASGLRGVDRRLQPHNPQNHQPLKCPRCDSQNTKFCYYNNYNLSQPRHFCKSCRRYWTNGGILRNVPVGGGCRKSRRSSTKSKSSADTSASNIYSATDTEKPEVISSSLTTTTTTTTVSISGMAARLDQYQPLIEQHQETLNCQMLPVTNMVSSSPEPGLVDSNQERKNEKEKILGCNTSEMVNMGFLDQHQEVVQVDEMALEQQSSEKNSGLATLDWGNVGTGGDAVNKTGGDGGAEHGLFDVTGVDETYWNQVQWIDDNEQSFNFLPQFQVLDFNLDNK